MQTNFIKLIQESVFKKGEISPFLFLYSNGEIFHSQLLANLHAILRDYKMDDQSLFILPDTYESLKIEEVKNFLAQGDVRPRFDFQIFLIENVSRMTTQAQNACLKFFEEPGEGNIILLTNHSESGILETILSRVQVRDERLSYNTSKNDFFTSLIEKHISGISQELIRYFFSGKYEKEEYIDFLKSLISYIGENKVFINILDEIEEDIGGIMNNNLQARYIVDKYIMKISH